MLLYVTHGSTIHVYHPPHKAEEESTVMTHMIFFLFLLDFP